MAYTVKAPRFAGTAAALLDVVQKKQKQDEEVKAETRKFRQRILELSVEAGIKAGTIDPFTLQRTEPKSFDFNGLTGGADLTGYDKPKFDVNLSTGERRASFSPTTPLSPGDQAKAQELALIQQATPQPRDIGAQNLVRTPQGTTQEFNPQEIEAGVPQAFATRRLDVMRHGRQTAGATPQQDVDDIVRGLSEGIVPPDPSQVSFRDRTRVNAALTRRGTNLAKLNLDWKATQAAVKNANSTQQLRMRQALLSVQESVPVLRQLNDEFIRSGFTPLNKAQLLAAITGTDPIQRDLATRYVSQINLMKDELAQGFMGGGVPTESAFKLTEDILNPAYGGKQLSAALDQLETNIGIRMNAISSVEPLLLGNETTRQRTSAPTTTRRNQPSNGFQTTTKGNRYRIVQ